MKDDEERQEPATDEFPDHVDIDVPEGDALEQEKSWEPGSKQPNPDIPMDVNEADALDQARDAGQDPDDVR
jgi:hypothetical protein